MPELPEVETIVRGLQRKVLKRTFLDVWTDNPKMIKKPKSFEEFRKAIKGKKILKIWRRGKNIIFDLSGGTRPELAEGLSLLVHQKLTGHLLVGRWAYLARRANGLNREFKNNQWIPPKGPLSEKINTFIHLLFKLDNGLMIALSDVRKFAKAELWRKDELLNSKEFKELGPEPLDKSFTFERFKETLRQAPARGEARQRRQGKLRRGKIKQVLMNQAIIAGIGNIYSDEILWQAKIHPLKSTPELSEKELKAIYSAIKEILPKAIKLGGESISDFRDIEGRRGDFDKERKVYRREGEKCSRCKTIIKRLKMAGRSAHFCPVCQKN